MGQAMFAFVRRLVPRHRPSIAPSLGAILGIPNQAAKAAKEKVIVTTNEPIQDSQPSGDVAPEPEVFEQPMVAEQPVAEVIVEAQPVAEVEPVVVEDPMDTMPPPFSERFADTLQDLQTSLRREETARLSVEERLAAEATAFQRATDEERGREDAEFDHDTTKTAVGMAFDGLIVLAREWQAKNL